MGDIDSTPGELMRVARSSDHVIHESGLGVNAAASRALLGRRRSLWAQPRWFTIACPHSWGRADTSPLETLGDEGLAGAS